MADGEIATLLFFGVFMIAFVVITIMICRL